MSRSYKYHRPRGLLTASYHDPGCFFQVGDEPNVRGAHRQAEPGMDVRSQNTWPSLTFDAESRQPAGRPLPRPRLLLQDLHQAAAPVAALRARPAAVRARRPRVAGHAPGHGRQALRPSRRARRRGRPGGHGRRRGGRRGRARRSCWPRRSTGSAVTCAGATPPTLPPSRELRELVAATPGIEVLTNAVVAGRYDDNWIAVVRRGLPGGAEQLIKAAPRCWWPRPG